MSIFASPAKVYMPIASPAKAYTPNDSLVHEDACAICADSITGGKTINHATAVFSKTSTVEVIEQTLLYVITPVEDIIVLVEDATS